MVHVSHPLRTRLNKFKLMSATTNQFWIIMHQFLGQHDHKPEIAGVSMPSPISMHMPNIAIKSNTLLAIILLLKKLASLLWSFAPACPPEWKTLGFESMHLEGRIPIFKFLQSNEYKAKVPPRKIELCRCQHSGRGSSCKQIWLHKIVHKISMILF